MFKRITRGLNTYTTKSIQFEKPLKIPEIPEPKRTHNRLVCNLKLEGFMDDHLNFVAYFAMKTGHKMGMPTSPVIALPSKIEKWHVNKSPFVHAKTKEVFEKVTYTRAIQVYDSHPDTIKEWIDYVNKNLPAGIHLRVEEFQWVNSDFANGLPPVEKKKNFESEVMSNVNRYLRKFQPKK